MNSGHGVERPSSASVVDSMSPPTACTTRAKSARGSGIAGVSVVVAGAAAVNAEVVDDAPPAAVAFTEELPTAEAPASVAQTSVAHVADVAAPEAVPGTGALESSAVTTTTATPALDSMSSSTTASMPIAPTTSTTVPSTTSTAVGPDDVSALPSRGYAVYTMPAPSASV